MPAGESFFVRSGSACVSTVPSQCWEPVSLCRSCMCCHSLWVLMYISPLVCGRLFLPNHLLWLPYILLRLPYILLAGYTQQDRMLLILLPRRHTYYLFCIPNLATTCILLLSSRLHTQTSFRMEPPQPQVLPQTYTQHPRTSTRQSPSVGSSKHEESFKLFQT